MNLTALTALSLSLIVASAGSLLAQTTPDPADAPSSEVVPVTVENFVRAETDLYFSAVALKEGGFGKLSTIATWGTWTRSHPPEP